MAVDNSETPPYMWTTYPERLQAAGITWRNYQEPDTGDDNPLAWFHQYQTAPTTSPLYRYGMATVPPGTLAQSFAEVGGFLSSEVYDHTSTIRFMERIFGVEEPNISEWRRQNTGDLTGALNLERRRRVSIPTLPYNYLLNQYVNSQDQNNPVVPTAQTLPTQEPGSRPPVPP